MKICALQSFCTVSLAAVELETRTQAFAIEREANALATAEAASSIKILQTAAAAAEAHVARQTLELQEAKARPKAFFFIYEHLKSCSYAGRSNNSNVACSCPRGALARR